MAPYKRKSQAKKDKPRKNPEALLRQLIDWADSVNVADDLDDDIIASIGAKVVAEFGIDHASRAEWESKAKKSLERAKMKTSTKTYPFAGASNVKYPLLATAALQFAARAYPAIVDGQKIVKGQIIGEDAGVPVMGPDGQPAVDPQTGEPQWKVKPGAKKAKAERISKHMSHQLINEMPDWEEDTDALVHQLPIIGCAFRKVWHDSTLNRRRSEMISAIDFVVNQKTRSLDTAPRGTHCYTLYPHEIEERQADGAFLDCDLGIANGAGDDTEAPHDFLEQFRFLDLNEDGYREPWIVTVHKDTSKVVRIVANYDPAKLALRDDRLARIERYNMYVKYPFFRDPEGGFYDLGFGELLETLSEVIDSTLNQMLDAGHLQNSGGGFIGSGLRLKKAQLRFAPGQYHVVDAPGQKVREAIYNMEHPGPSSVLFQLLGMMVESGKEIANIKDILTGSQNSQTPATTTLAMIEQGMKVYTSIYKRLYRSLKKEYTLLFELNAKHLDEQNYFTVMDDQLAVSRSDYDSASFDVFPVADPNVVTDAQKMARAQVYLEVSQHPMVNGHEAMKRFFEAMGAEQIEAILPPPQPPSPPPPPNPDETKLAIEKEKTALQMQLTEKKHELDMQIRGLDRELKVLEIQSKRGDVAARREDAEIERGLKIDEMAHRRSLMEIDIAGKQRTIDIETRRQDEMSNMVKAIQAPRRQKIVRGKDGRPEYIENSPAHSETAQDV